MSPRFNDLFRPGRESGTGGAGRVPAACWYLNRDPAAVRCLEWVWVFGSLMRGEDKLRDIDVALETTWRPEDLPAYAGTNGSSRSFCRAATKSQPSLASSGQQRHG